MQHVGVDFQPQGRCRLAESRNGGSDGTVDRAAKRADREYHEAKTEADRLQTAYDELVPALDLAKKRMKAKWAMRRSLMTRAEKATEDGKA